MKKLILTTLLIIAAAGTFAEETKQTTCPVMGGKINKELFVDANGVRIYVCCKGCIAKVKADPEKYIKQLQAEGVELEKTPQSPTNNKPDEDELPDSIIRYRLHGNNPQTEDEIKSDPSGFEDKMKGLGIQVKETPAR